MRILVATAQPDLRLSLELLLSEQPGVEIVGTASEGDGLLALVRTTRPDMILADWDLPGRPLSEVIAEALRQQPSPTTLLLIKERSSRQAAMKIGADAVVIKGGSPDSLISTFEECRRKKVARQEVDNCE